MFKPQFAPLVKSGAKRQTIRPMPKRMPKPGDLESWREWTGQPYRSKQSELAQVRLTSVERIQFWDSSGHFLISLPDRPLNGTFTPIAEWREIAYADGFQSLAALLRWFEREHGLPFVGILIRSKDL